MFIEVYPAKKKEYLGLKVSTAGFRITKELREKIDSKTIGIKRDTDELEIAIYPGGKHIIHPDGRVSLPKTQLQLPDGRYILISEDKESGVYICKMSV